jgi:hypothetical protein
MNAPASEELGRRMPQEVGGMAAGDIRRGDHPAIQLAQDGREEEQKAKQAYGIFLFLFYGLCALHSFLHYFIPITFVSSFLRYLRSALPSFRVTFVPALIYIFDYSTYQVRKMMTWSHCRFLNRLLSKAEELGKKIVIVSEAYTSKTCSACGWVDQNLGGRKVFGCRRCGWVVDRDVNGARGIFLRGLLFLEELANREGPNEGFA